MRHLVAVVAVFLVVIGATKIATAAVSEPRIALVIGNSAYKDTPLTTPVNDARLMAETLRGLGFDVIESIDADQVAMQLAAFELQYRLLEAGADAVGLFYYAGHGVQVSGQNYLIPLNANLKKEREVAIKAVSVGFFLKQMEFAGNRMNFVILDACRNNPLTRGFRSPTRGLARMDAPRGSLVAYSTAPGEVAADGTGANSPYTLALAQAMRTPGVPAEKMFKLVRDSVMGATKGEQTPWEESSLTGADFYFSGDVSVTVEAAPAATAQSITVTAATTQQESAFWQAVKDTTDPASFEYYLTEYPNGKFAALARLRIKQLAEKQRQKEAAAAKDKQTAAVMPTPSRPDPNSPAAGMTAYVIESEKSHPDVGAMISGSTRISIESGGHLVIMIVSGEMIRKDGPYEGYAAAIIEQASSSGTRDEGMLESLLELTKVTKESGRVLAAERGTTRERTTEPITRFPTLDTVESVEAGETFPVQVWLSEEVITPDVVIEAGEAARVTSKGALELKLPETPEREGWTINVVLTAPNFEVVQGGMMQAIELPLHGDSTPALFMLKARPGPDYRRTEKLRVTLWHDGAYLARVTRSIIVITPGASGGEVAHAPKAGTTMLATVDAEASTAPATTRQKMSFDAGARLPDITVYIRYDQPSQLGKGQIIIASPHFNPPSRLIVDDVDTPTEVIDWLAQQYRHFVRDSRRVNADPTRKDRSMARMRGFGEKLFKEYAPSQFKRVFWNLYDDPGIELRTIQIFSNNPVLPWELMRPNRGDGGQSLDFLGVEFLIGRWHVSESVGQLDRPLQALLFEELVAIVPRYEGDKLLPFQEVELAMLQNVPGYREVRGQYSAVQELMGDLPQGVVHFSGHGSVQLSLEGVPTYTIQLEKSEIDIMTWRGMSATPSSRHPLYFFNACELGQAQSVANFVEGWAPAVLDRGASGYIGGMWSLVDSSAARFAARFYDTLMGGAESGPVAIAAALQEARRLFNETGDPTYMAYAYYGDVNLRLIASSTDLSTIR